MRRKRIASLDLKGLCRLLGLFGGLFLGAEGDAQAQTPAGPPPDTSSSAVSTELPILFDARERLSRPDLSALLRLRFLTAVDFPPFNFADQGGRLTGFNIDLVREICRELKIEPKCQIQALPYDELEAALDTGQGDAVIAGVAVTAKLRERYRFSRPYLFLPARFLRNMRVSVDGAGPEALAGRPVGVVRNTVHEAMLKAFFPGIGPIGFDSRTQLLDALQKGEIAAAFGDGLQLSFWANSPRAEGCCRLFGGPYLSEAFLGEGMTILLRQQDGAVADAIDSALSAISRDGRLQELALRYFPYGLY